MATLDIFSLAERFVPAPARTRIDLLSSPGGAMPLGAAAQIATSGLPPSLAQYDAVILPGFLAEDGASLARQLHGVWRPVVDRLARLARPPLLAASCHGTFVLAESGLLDGRVATTAWWMRAVFRARYPAVRLDAGLAVAADGPLLTAGAMTAHVDLAMAVLGRLHGDEVARRVGAIMLVNGARSSQQPFIAPPDQFDDPLVARATGWMAQHLAAPFDTSTLARACHVSYRTLHRRFAQATGHGPLEHMQAMRVEHAKRLLERGAPNLEHIVSQVGYSDSASFRNLFRRMTGLSPAEYRRQFRAHP